MWTSIKTWAYKETLSSADINAYLSDNTDYLYNSLVPIGSIIPFYDFNGALSFNTDFWAYCDGSSKTFDGVSRTLPDLSNRYLVGFGTEAGGDIDTAAWATAAVGSANHTVDLSHTHDMGNHTHIGPSHTHGPGNLNFHVMSFGSVGPSSYSVSGSGPVTNLAPNNDSSGSYVLAFGSAGSAIFTMTDASGGVSGSGGNSATGAPSTNTTSSSSSSSQSIQPRSIRVRYLMRIS